MVGIPLTGVDERRGRSRLDRARRHKNRVRRSTPYRLLLFKALDLTDKVTMFVIQMKNALRGLSAPAAWQTPEKFFI